MRRSIALPLALVALTGCPPAPGDSAPPEPDPADVTERLGPGQVRAGEVLDEAALFGGVAAEGRIGDFKIYNDRVQFIIQGVREGSFTAWQGGMVIDADVVRPAGQPGRDTVDDWAVIAGNGLLLDPVSVRVLDDGAESGRAVIRAEGPESPLDYVVGFFENPGIIPEQGLYFITDYSLEADSDLLEVSTTVEARERDVSVPLGDVLLGSKELTVPWVPGTGLTSEVDGEFPWVALAGKRNEQSLAILGAGGATFAPHPALGFVGSLLTAVSAFGDPLDIPEGGSATVTRWYGVGSDLATLSDAWLTRDGGETSLAEGYVEAPDGPVAGARVAVLRDGAPWTLAVTDAEGAFAAQIPAGGELSFVADGRGTGLWPDLPAGAAPFGPYSAAPVQAEALASLSAGAEPVVLARGRGWTAGASPLALGEPATLTVSSGDGSPFEARLAYATAFDGGDGHLVQGSPSGYAALAWARDGEVSLQIEPGEYTLIAWRGVRSETAVQAVTLAAGAETRVDVTLAEAYRLDGWLEADSHVHASPSPDGSITMEERVLVEAAQGIQAHFGTDHDHIVDYNPVVEVLVLGDRVKSVVACELSPIVRGHLNLYPLTPRPGELNNGAWPWWIELVETTADEFAAFSEHLGDPLVQLNHPMDGLASLAGWSPGLIARGDYWCDDFDAIEVMNGGGVGGAVDFWLDLAARGLVTAPVGTSDSHGYIGSSGLSVTFLEVGTADPAALTDDALREAITERRTVVSRGPFLDLSIPPGSTVTVPTTLEVEVLAPSWIAVDTIALLRDGQIIETVAGTSASFALDPETDALYVVQAWGSASMAPVTGDTPWAMSGPLLFDVDGDGWSAPLPALEVR